MSQNVQSVGALPSQSVIAPASSTDHLDLPDRRPSQDEASQLARYRLIIDGEPRTGYVYKSVDRVTGEIVSQFPQEALEQLGANVGYAGGTVIDTTA